MSGERYMIAASCDPLTVRYLRRMGEFPEKARALVRDMVNDCPIVWVHDDNGGAGYTEEEARSLLPGSGAFSYSVRPLEGRGLRDRDGTGVRQLAGSLDGRAVCVAEDIAAAFSVSLSTVRNWARKALGPAEVCTLANGRKVYRSAEAADILFGILPGGMVRVGRGGNTWRRVSREEAEKRLENGFLKRNYGTDSF